MKSLEMQTKTNTTSFIQEAGILLLKRNSIKNLSISRADKSEMESIYGIQCFSYVLVVKAAAQAFNTCKAEHSSTCTLPCKGTDFTSSCFLIHSTRGSWRKVSSTFMSESLFMRSTFITTPQTSCSQNASRFASQEINLILVIVWH